MSGFFMLKRNEATRELMRDPKAFTLLALIAYRAKWSGAFSVHNLKPGQALIGDYRSIGLSPREYRTAKERLEKYHLATFQGTNKGTVATLLNTEVFDIFGTSTGEQEDTRPTTQEHTPDNPRATNEDGEDRKKGKPDKPTCAGLRWIDYEAASLPEIEDYDAIHGAADPVLVAVAVTRERAPRAWKFWQKILNRARKIHGPETADTRFKKCVAELFGEVKAGECEKPGAVLNLKLKKAFPGVVT